MKLEEIRKITIIGAGAMGSQMAEVFSRLGGFEVNMVDISDELVQKGLKSIDQTLERFFVAKGKITAEEKAAITGRIKGYTSLEEAVKETDSRLLGCSLSTAGGFKRLLYCNPPETPSPETVSSPGKTRITSPTHWLLARA